MAGVKTGGAATWVERWWAGEAGWLGRLLDLALAPAEMLFRGVVELRGLGYDRGLLHAERVPVPVISVGNLSVGGAGKTPVTRWLVGELLRRGVRPAVLHGGYGTDEPRLHVLWHPEVPVIVGRDRRESARLAVERGAEVLVLDDGYQHRRLARDLDLVLVAAESWKGDRRLLPRGPWREPASGLARADAVLVTRKTAAAEDAEALRPELGRYAPGAVVARVRLRPSGWTRWGGAAGGKDGEGLGPTSPGPSGEVWAVTGIAHPELFVENVREIGVRVAGSNFFPDHHEYDLRDLERIRSAAAGRPIVTTAKDMVKLSTFAGDLEIWVLEQEVVVEEGAEALSELLDQLLARAGVPVE